MHNGQHKPHTPYHQLNESSLEFVKAYLQSSNFMDNFDKDLVSDWQEMISISHIYQKWFHELMSEPNKLWQAQLSYFKDYLALCQNMQSFWTDKKPSPIVESGLTDKRFKSSEWQTNPLFYFLQQSYLLFVEHCLHFVEQNPSHDPKIAKQIQFFTRNYLNSLSPANFFLTNPDVIKETIESKGENVLHGLTNLLDDVTRGKGHLNIKMSDSEAFEVGRNIAITPGKVIFQNRLIQLIQYQPTTEQVYERPLLIVPPWINKYYILDLREQNSLVKWLVNQGHTVFIISWVNPDKSYYSTDFEDYMFEGTLAAMDAVKQATKVETLNVVGFCIGGTLLATTLAYMKAIGENAVHSATFLASLIDFAEPGDLSVFFDEEQVTLLEAKMKNDGFLDGRTLMTTFNFLRPNDLYWPYYINNYLCGKTPLAFDLLHWNSDPVNLPGKMISFYVRHMYMDNLLCKPGGITLGGEEIDLSKVDIPTYFLSTELDHIAPWEATFAGAQCLSGNVKFVLGGSGHIAGIVNPPENHKYGYRYNDMDVKEFDSPQDWYDKSQNGDGSWWQHWHQWLKNHSGKKCKARVPGEGALKPIQDAPGDYVKKRL
jgi:polyhydroxyalkanoate synthase